MPRYLPVMPRLLKDARKIEDTGCLLFERQQDHGGYGRLMVKGKRQAAHRAAWEATHGKIPAGRYVCHRCDTPACVNPDHLFLGTAAENVQDMLAKGRDRRTPLPGEKNGRAKLTREQAAAVRTDRRTGRDVADAFNISPAQVYRIRSGKQWAYEEEWK